MREVTRKMLRKSRSPARKLVRDTMQRFNQQHCCVRTICILILLPFLLILIGHSLLLKYGFDYYSDPCYLARDKVATMRYMILAVSDIYAQTNQNYWLEGGTLLGVIRDGDVLPHDGDVDISRIMYDDPKKEEEFMVSLGHELSLKGMTLTWIGNTQQPRAEMNGIHTDLMRWVYRGPHEREKSHMASVCLHPEKEPRINSPQCREELSKGFVARYRPHKPEKVNYRLHQIVIAVQGGEVFRADLFLPPVSHPLAFSKERALTKIPQKSTEYLVVKYGSSWRVPVYFKWKCYFQSKPNWIK